MINLWEGEILNLLPLHLIDDVQVQCLSYAIKMEMQRLKQIIDRVESIRNVDLMDEQLLDYFAIEWRTQYYDDELPIEKKRALVKNTFNWHRHAGTPEVVQELVDIVFDGADIAEWYDIGTEPGTFIITLNEALIITPEVMQRFARMIQKAKNTRSHLIAIGIKRETELEIKFAHDQVIHSVWNIDSSEKDLFTDLGIYLAHTQVIHPVWDIDCEEVEIITLIRMNEYQNISHVWKTSIDIDAEEYEFDTNLRQKLAYGIGNILLTSVNI